MCSSQISHFLCNGMCKLLNWFNCKYVEDLMQNHIISSWHYNNIYIYQNHFWQSIRILMVTYQRDWFSLRLFNALNISTTTNTVIDTVDGCRSSNILQGYKVSLVEQLSKFIWKKILLPISILNTVKRKITNINF